VLDEGHKVNTDITYRDAFRSIYPLLGIGVPVITLSGSFPETMIPKFKEYTGLESLDIIRMATARPELVYSVHVKPKAELMKAMKDYANSVLQSYASADRLIIFCRTRTDTDLVASEFAVKPVYAGLEENQQTFNDWVSGKNQIMVSSPLLGCGIDVSGVRHCIHYDLAHTAIDQYQEECRAGRDGKLAHAVTFVAAN